MATHLNEIDQERLLADFEDWSGGFPPEECTLRQIESYLRSSSPVEIDQDAATEFLINRNQNRREATTQIK